MTDLPRKAIVRSAKLASLPIGFAGRTALGIGKRIGGRPAEIVAAELQARTAEQLFSVLGQLKGGAMKVGQAMSILEAALPEDIAGPYRTALVRLQDAAPPMPSTIVHDILRRDLGTRWRTKLVELDDRPAASASIGQVHRGRWKDGREVAVKVQYPGAGEALMSDLKLISRVLRVSAGWVPGLDLAPILRELQERMGEEVDYAHEATCQRGAAAAFRDHPDIVVPDVVAAAGDVLVTEWLEGRPLSDVIATGTDDERADAAHHYLEFLLLGPKLAGLLHADPHPGNFRITADGRLGVLDWGAVAHLADGMPPEIGRLLGYGVDGDATRVLAGLRELGFVRPSVDLEAGALLDYLEPFLAPMRSAEFTFSRAWLRGVFAKINDPRQPGYTVAYKINLPPDYLLIHRVWLGGIGVLSQLESTVATAALLGEHLPGFPVE